MARLTPYLGARIMTKAMKITRCWWSSLNTSLRPMYMYAWLELNGQTPMTQKIGKDLSKMKIMTLITNLSMTE